MTSSTTRIDRADVDAVDSAKAARPRRRLTVAPIAVRVPEAAKMLGISRSRFYELIESGDIEIVKLGRSTLVPVASLHSLIERLRRKQAKN